MKSLQTIQVFLSLSVVTSAVSQETSPKIDSTVSTHIAQSNYFQTVSGGLNAVFKDQKTKGGLDMAVQTCHYFLVTGKRHKNDSIHRAMIQNGKPYSEVYKGFHFYLLNRAAMHFDSIRMMASNYLTSLKSSPFTIRIQRQFFLTKRKKMSHFNFSPLVSIDLVTDGRAVPYLDRFSRVKVGASGHVFLTLSTQFKRIEFNKHGKKVDQGVIYFKPSIGIGFGSNEMMRSVRTTAKNEPFLSTECRLGFHSDKNAVKDFSFLVNYSISDLIGPKLSMGVLLTALGN